MKKIKMGIPNNTINEILLYISFIFPSNRPSSIIIIVITPIINTVNEKLITNMPNLNPILCIIYNNISIVIISIPTNNLTNISDKSIFFMIFGSFI